MSNQVNAKFSTVMVIDDNVIDLYISSRMITKNNFGKDVLLYSNAEDALKFLIENKNDPSLLPKIIFVDIYMPIMSGFEFLEFYASLADDLKNNCKVYIVSSTIDDNDILRAAADVNIDSFQVKPITKYFLDSIIPF